MHGQQTIQNAYHVQTPRKHIVPTHLNMPDQVLSVWSLSLSARQLLLVLVGFGIGGTLFQHLAFLANDALPGEMLRFILALPPFLLALLLAWYQYAGRYLEVWLVVLVRYRLRPKRYLWRSIRHYTTKGDMLCLYAPGSPTKRCYRAVLEVSPINFSLKAEEEQEAIIERFSALIRSLSFPLQILVRNQRLDLAPYIHRLFAKPQGQVQHLPTWYMLARSLAVLLQKIASQRTLIERHVFVIIPASQGT